MVTLFFLKQINVGLDDPVIISFHHNTWYSFYSLIIVDLTNCTGTLILGGLYIFQVRQCAATTGQHLVSEECTSASNHDE